MNYQIKKYLQFLLSATNQHGVHSPFVYDFVTQCLHDKKKYPAYAKLKTYRNNLLTDQNTIEITDFGAGSRKFKSNTRKISALAKTAGASPKRMRLLYRVSNYFQPQHTLELGTSLGLATAALGLGNSGKTTSVEGCAEIAKIAKNKLKTLKIEQLSLKTARFAPFIESNSEKNFDLIYFDGNHSKEATLSYFEKLLPTAHNNSVWIFDDIYWSAGMTAAWEQIKKHPDVQVSIDCFWLGFVFFRREQDKEHFKIRL